MFAKIEAVTEKIKKHKPLILNITNTVTMDFIANGLLSVGASPIMSQAEEEANDLIEIAHTVVINIGTLNKAFISLAKKACEIANQLNKPIIFDPVGAGASTYRTNTCLQFIANYNIAIIRGNASEINALAGGIANTKGVCSTIESNAVLENAKLLSERHDATIMVSGETDFIIDHQQSKQFSRGSILMPMITGTGCLLTAISGAFHAVENNRFEAASMAALFYSVCGELAAKKASGPGTFKSCFLDKLAALPQYEQYI
jgi:hydroxyethylthiazole kinase